METFFLKWMSFFQWKGDSLVRFWLQRLQQWTSVVIVINDEFLPIKLMVNKRQRDWIFTAQDPLLVAF